jgi:tetratricopeptide (TPR) repeat protein
MRIKKSSSRSQQEYLPLECNLYYARKDRVEIYIEMGDIVRAIDEYEIILKELKNNNDKNSNDKKYDISDAFMKRAGLFLQNNETEKALSDYLAVIELGVTGFDYTIKDAYAARIEIYKTRGEMDKAFADYLKMSELKKEDSRWDNLLTSTTKVEVQEYEIIDDE